jgi:uncharacterized membrane-anchored protein
MLPADYPERRLLADEVHARPPEALTAPLDVDYMAVLTTPDTRAELWAHALSLFDRMGRPAPAPGTTYVAATVGDQRIVLERHSEFIRCMAIGPPRHGPGFDGPSFEAFPADWMPGFTGRLLVGTRVKFLRRYDFPAVDPERLSASHFAGNGIVGATLAGGLGSAFTDFRIHADGCGRLVMIDEGLQPRQAGRMLQRLLEVDTYRMMALLALPVARRIWPQIERGEVDLATIASGIAQGVAEQEAALLERLMTLEASVQRLTSEHHYRFSASAAYYDLVRTRIDDLREQRIEGLQTFREFTERRLAPAMATCRTAATNLSLLSTRIAQTTQLLSTRVEVTLAEQNRARLADLAIRAKQQLQLQRTVEGLSVVALTYYVVGLLAYVFKGARAGGSHVDPDYAVGLAVPIALILIGLGIRWASHHLGALGAEKDDRA